MSNLVVDDEMQYFNNIGLHPLGQEGTPATLVTTAYCIYHFLLPDYQEEALVRIGLSSNLYSSSAYIALANYSRNTWDWYSVDDSGELALPSLAPYFDADGNLHVLFAVTGGSNVVLAWVVIGGTLPPDAVMIYSIPTGPAPLTVIFSLVGDHADPDGALSNVEWDFDGDGVFDTSGMFPWEHSYTYETPGEYHPVLRVTDDDGATATAELTVTVTTS
jgi:PKD repeat protein